MKLRILFLLLWLLTISVAAQAQFTYVTNNGSITITGYNCPGTNGTVTIPNTLNGRPVTSIGIGAFSGCTNLVSITIPDSVTSLGESAFNGCTGLTNVTIGNSMSTIGSAAFYGCTGLTSVTIPNSVTNIGYSAFYGCDRLAAVYFGGNAPALDQNLFRFSNNAAVYYLLGTSGWSSTFEGRPTIPWYPRVLSGPLTFGIRSNQFGFTINWASDKVVVVEFATNVVNPVWIPVSTNILTGGSSYFSDPQWTNYPSRLYRLRAP